MTTQELALFNDTKIRRIWDPIIEQRYFSVVDVVSALSGSTNPQVYRRVLKKRLNDEGSDQTVTNCNAFKMKAQDGKMRKTDIADVETIFRIIQSIPSPNAEPFKLWLAKVGYERVQEVEDPELAINRALQGYLAKGYSEDRVNQRLKTIEVRKQLTDEWKKSGILGKEYAILTDEITRARAGMSTRDYKDIKGLHKQNLRDNMSNLELILNMLAEATTTEISKTEHPHGLTQHKQVAQRGGKAAGDARKSVEQQTGKSVITKRNNLGLQ